MLLHTPTLLLANTTLYGVLAVCLVLATRYARADGLHFWALGLTLLAAGFLLLSFQSLEGQEWATIVLANVLRVAAFAMFVEATCQFLQRPAKRWLIWSALPVALVAFIVFLPNARLRVLFGALLPLYLLVLLGRQMLAGRAGIVGRGQHFLLAGALLLGLVLAAHIWAALTGRIQAEGLADNHLPHALTLLAALTATMLMTFGFVIMTKERVDERNQKLAFQDELTGINNRRCVRDALNRQIARIRRQGGKLSALLLDIDHFKNINDTKGHQTGDVALQKVAGCIQGRLRAEDVAGRWGGEEFIILLPDTDANGARVVAEQLRRAVEQLRFSGPDHQEFALTVSIGVSELDVGTHEADETMLRHADQALYKAKELGRNRVEQV